MAIARGAFGGLFAAWVGRTGAMARLPPTGAKAGSRA